MIFTPTPMGRVFPAYAGVFPDSEPSDAEVRSLPRIRGGVSCLILTAYPTKPSSPHTRGCFHKRRGNQSEYHVFPAYAGVFPCRGRHAPPERGLPRIRGGVSCANVVSCIVRESSPHTRGCFCASTLESSAEPVFPAYAGVFPDLNLSG